ncbi:MAG: bifunctional 5,10-methylenetetrahydrofolate dehydrogenase/5,10-methenyltetrahydrofolate cyclohydrolase [Dehalococcoidia bacterium]|nr:bifunctional 5,10-methylenetetrahydrofolate dehydrogenase/5,10-methenyltetrahydrofolate cyclohydrolase [Dehalococcoidia bacterium]
MPYQLIDGKNLSTQILNEITENVGELKKRSEITPGLSVVLVGDDPASDIYVRSKERAALKVGMVVKLIRMPRQSSEDKIIEIVGSLNNDINYHGILVQLPLPDHVDQNRVITSINPLKDVDGLHPFNAGLLAAGEPRFIPATPGGIREILLRTNNDPSGKHVVVIGRSNIVGRPVSNLLSLKGKGGDATVTVCHSRTKDLTDICRSADVIIAAIGIPNFVKGDMVSEGVVAIDVGINRVNAPEKKRGYMLVGDIEFESVARKAAAITPVPGGVGPMTIAMLLSNTLYAADIFRHG